MKSIQIDEEGYFASSGIRLHDEEYCRQLLSTLTLDNRAFYIETNGEKILVEAVDDPLVVRHVERINDGYILGTLPYSSVCTFDLKTLRADLWDRFHARTVANLPAVLSRSAQMELFDMADGFDDDSITFHGVRYPVLPLGQIAHDKSESSSVNSPSFWTTHYDEWQSSVQDGGDATKEYKAKKPGWELGAPAEPLRSVLPQIKLPKSRICVLGSGSGHDAAYFAEQGHVVTGVDFSETAVTLARAKYTANVAHPNSETANGSTPLQFVEADAFNFSKKHRGDFDVVFEHTFFCAIDPLRRAEAVETWSRLLAPGGHLLGIFFILDRGANGNDGPPFGATEWEIRELLKPKFEFLYWTRWKHSIPSRVGKELVVFAKKNEAGSR